MLSAEVVVLEATGSGWCLSGQWEWEGFVPKSAPSASQAPHDGVWSWERSGLSSRPGGAVRLWPNSACRGHRDPANHRQESVRAPYGPPRNLSAVTAPGACAIGGGPGPPVLATAPQTMEAFSPHGARARMPRGHPPEGASVAPNVVEPQCSLLRPANCAGPRRGLNS